MGAYYEYQLTYEPTPEKKRTICVPTLGGHKFCEMFYGCTDNTLLLLSLIQKYGEVIVNTVCDCDKEGAFANAVPFDSGDKLNFTERRLVSRIQKIEAPEYLCMCRFFSQFFTVCDERKEYVELAPFILEDWVLSPIALLTRSSKDMQGGGDFGVESIESGQFVTYWRFSPYLVGAWKDCKIYLCDHKPDGYRDVTKSIFAQEKG